VYGFAADACVTVIDENNNTAAAADIINSFETSVLLRVIF
jgi:hypothetical protein